MMDFASELYSEIAGKLKTRRMEMSLSQTDLARKVDLKRTSIANIEAARQRPPLHLLYELCQALDLEVKEILPRFQDVESKVTTQLGEAIGNAPPKTAAAFEQLLEKTRGKQ